MSATTPLLMARGVTKRFGPAEALADVDFDVVVISHNLDNVFHVADRISVLRVGRATFVRRTASREEVVTATTGAVARSETKEAA